MKRFLGVFSLLLVLVFVQQSFAQPSVRDGWPLDYGPAGQMASLIEPNPLSVGVTSDGTRIIASATNFQVRILDIDGTLLQDVNLNGAVPDPAGANYLAGGPVIGDVDGDGEVEVVAALRAANGRTRAIVVIELDGTINSTISQGWSLANVDISSLVMENMDDDNALEIIFFCDDQLHVLDNDGTDMTGFPWTISRGQGYAAPAILPAEFNDGTPVILWPSMDGYIHAREVGATTEVTGYPIAFTGSAGVVMPAPVVIPTDAGWDVAVVTNSHLHLWDQNGNVLNGFPFTPSAVDASIHTLQAADLDGDSSPELVFRYYNSDLVHAVTLSGSYLNGFPVSTTTGAGRSESVAAVKMSSSAEAMFFCGSLGPGSFDSHLYGFQGNTLITGFPMNYTTNEMIPIMSTAVFPPIDGVMSIVQGSVYGYITVYDLTVTDTETGTIEWQTPYGNSAGNRCYDPQPFVTEIEGPLFVASPTTLDYETLRLDSTRTLSFSVTNNGTEAGDITALAFVDVAEGTFSHDATLPITLDPEASTTINVTWTPDAVGDLDGSITVTHSEDVNGTESTIALTGTCAVWPDLVFPTEDLTFGTIWDDDPHGTVTFEIENTGNGQGIIDTVTIASAYSSVITVANDFPVMVEPGATTSITLNWNPEELGDITTSVYVFHNDPASEGMTELAVAGSYQSGVNEELIPAEYFLAQNYPNPFNPETTIRFGLKEAGQVTLKVYNLNGQEVMGLENGYREAGNYNVSFNGKNLASGVYIYTMKVNEFTSTRKMLLIQ